MKAFSYEEAMAKNKIIRFYDLSLLSSLSIIYGKAGIKYLEKASTDEKVKGPAMYYLGIANAFFGDIDESTKVLELFASTAKMPAMYKNTAKVMLAENRYLKGDKAKAKRILDDMAQATTSPYMLSDILFACSRLQVECNKTAKKAFVMVEAGEGKAFSRVSFALGKYYLQKKDYVKAAFYMEAGRNRHKGRRPRVRGSAMNPVDHPHGGGEGKQPIGLKYPKTPWGKHALGKKTRKKNKQSNKHIVKRRSKRRR